MLSKLNFTLIILTGFLFVPCASGAIEFQLYDLYVRALEYDEQFLTSKEQITGAYLDSEIIKSEILPSLSSNISHSDVQSEITGPQRTVTSTGRYKVSRYQLQLSQSIYDPELFDQIDAQEFSQLSLEYELAVAQQNLVLKMLELFWDVRVNQQEYEFQKSKADLLIKKYEEGVAKRARGQLSSEEVNLLKTEMLGQKMQVDWAFSRYQDAKSQLHESTLYQYELPAPSSECRALSMPLVSDEELLNVGLQGNYQINQFRHQLAAYRKEYQATRSAYLPKLKLDVTYTHSMEDGGSFDGSESKDTQAKFSLSWPIYLGGRRSLQTQKSASRVEVTQAKLETYLPKLRYKINQSKNRIKLNEGLMKVMRDENNSRRSRLSSIKNRVSQGASTPIELVKEEVAYQEFLSRQQRVCRDLVVGQAEYLSLIGALNAELHLNQSL